MTAELQVAEAVALVNTLHNWTVLDKIILPTKNLDQKLIFGKGNFQILTGKKTKDVLKPRVKQSTEATLAKISANDGEDYGYRQRYTWSNVK